MEKMKIMEIMTVSMYGDDDWIYTEMMIINMEIITINIRKWWLNIYGDTNYKPMEIMTKQKFYELTIRHTCVCSMYVILMYIVCMLYLGI